MNRVSCFETLRVYEGVPWLLKEHLARLKDSCDACGIPFSPPPKEIARWVSEGVRASALKEATLRISVHPLPRRTGRLLLTIKPFLAHPEAFYERGVTLRTAVAKRWTLRAQNPYVKASVYVAGVLAKLDQGPLAAHELLFLDQNQNLAEGTVSNVFLVARGGDPTSPKPARGQKRLLTPSAASGILRGVTRCLVMQLASGTGLLVRETKVTRHELYNADECFITNTSSEVLPVVQVDGRQIGSGQPGPVTRCLAKAYRDCRDRAVRRFKPKRKGT